MPGYKNTLYLIGGTRRRAAWSFPSSCGIRPTLGRVRETVFNWLGQDLTGRICLDLFSGSGALGFEAASRGATEVIMIEKSIPQAKALQSNCKRLGFSQVKIILADAFQWLKKNPLHFDVIFLDPPFQHQALHDMLTILHNHLHDDALLYLECVAWPELHGWRRIRQSRAGQVHYGLLQQI